MPRQVAIGQLLANELLPPPLRDYQRVLDKQGVSDLLARVANEYPEQYRKISHGLQQLGFEAARVSGGFSFGPEHLQTARAAKRIREQVRNSVQEVLRGDLPEDARNERISEIAEKAQKEQQEEVYRESLEEDNPFSLQVFSGARGSPKNLSSLRGSDMLYTDHKDRRIPIPILHSFSEGLSPAEYAASAFGTRRSITDVKLGTARGGFLAKQLGQASHRQVVTRFDSETPTDPRLKRGFPVDTSDKDSVGALLAHPVGNIPANTPITARLLKQLQESGLKRILIRSPLVGGAPDGSLYGRDVGIREDGNMAGPGPIHGMLASQSVSEPLTQSMISSKHSGGVAGASKATSGFDYVNGIIQANQNIKGSATHSQVDGTFTRMRGAPAGGLLVTIGDEEYHVPAGLDLKIKIGDEVEAGDQISDGIPVLAHMVKHKGIGEGGRAFVHAFKDALRFAGTNPNRRNVEMITRGLIDHVQLTEEVGDHIPDDIVSYRQLEARWTPRDGTQTLPVDQSRNRYLEQPYLHFSIGTKVRPSVIKTLQEFGVSDIDTHEQPPPFEPDMRRGMYLLQTDPDWMTRFLGSGHKKSLLTAVHRGASSNEMGTSFVPLVAKGVNVGKAGPLQSPAFKPPNTDLKTMPTPDYDPSTVTLV